MSKKLNIILPNQAVKQMELGRNLDSISKELQEHYQTPIVAAKFNNELKELNFQPETEGEIVFLDLTTSEGMRIYHRSLAFLLTAATKELYPKAKLSIEHSLAKGLYCELHQENVLTEEDVIALGNKMREMTELELPIIKEEWPLEKAIDYFNQEGLPDKARLLKYRQKNYLNVYKLGSLIDYPFGYLVPNTACLKVFGLKYHMPGLELRYPDEENPNRLAKYEDRPKIFSVFREAEKWARILEVTTAGVLNDYIMEGKSRKLIQLNEAFHEKKIAQIADMIESKKDQAKVILISGPSSSGKTTFAQRLAIQLRVNGLKPISISLDDYFVDRALTPKDENGELDFEALEAIDIELFNKQLAAIIQGKEVEVPSYNFLLGKREYKNNRVQITQDQPIIVEGIHGLNEKLTASIPRDQKFKIYISAITSLNMDRHNRIPTTDTRLLRRIIRDNQFRGNDATKTINMWTMVRRGEENNIFPFQEEADVMFNSALVYELAILKKYAEPLLRTVADSSVESVTAKRLLGFLEYFVPLNDEDVPCNSILKEFTGDGCLVID